MLSTTNYAPFALDKEPGSRTDILRPSSSSTGHRLRTRGTLQLTFVRGLAVMTFVRGLVLITFVRGVALINCVRGLARRRSIGGSRRPIRNPKPCFKRPEH